MNTEQIKVLIVEDESIVALEIEIRLKQNNFIVVGTAASPNKAIEFALSKKPDVILMDINLKADRDGIEVGKVILSSIDTYIIFVSAFNDFETKERVKQIKNSKFLCKPFSACDLISAIKSYYPTPA